MVFYNTKQDGLVCTYPNTNTHAHNNKNNLTTKEKKNQATLITMISRFEHIQLILNAHSQSCTHVLI